MGSIFLVKLVAGIIGGATVVAAVLIGVFYAKHNKKQ